MSLRVLKSPSANLAGMDVRCLSRSSARVDGLDERGIFEAL